VTGSERRSRRDERPYGAVHRRPVFHQYGPFPGARSLFDRGFYGSILEDVACLQVKRPVQGVPLDREPLAEVDLYRQARKKGALVGKPIERNRPRRDVGVRENDSRNREIPRERSATEEAERYVLPEDRARARQSDRDGGPAPQTSAHVGVPSSAARRAEPVAGSAFVIGISVFGRP